MGAEIFATFRLPIRYSISMAVASCLAIWAAGWSIAASLPTEVGRFDSNGVTIRYASAGEGTPVVLIHGWMSDATMWGRDAFGKPRLAPVPGFRMIALDCRGHGESGKLHDPAGYGVEMAMDVVRLMDHLKIEKAHLVGYSMGAFIAGKVAAERPNRVLGIVFGGQAPLLVGRPPSTSDEVEVFAKAVEAGNGLGAYLLYVWPPSRPKPTPEAAEAIAKIQYGGKDVAAWAAAGRSLGKLELSPDALKNAAIPLLFVHGASDAAAVSATAYARKVLGRGEVVSIEGADHTTALVKPEFGKAIVAFLTSNNR